METKSLWSIGGGGGGGWSFNSGSDGGWSTGSDEVWSTEGRVWSTNGEGDRGWSTSGGGTNVSRITIEIEKKYEIKNKDNYIK